MFKCFRRLCTKYRENRNNYECAIFTDEKFWEVMYRCTVLRCYVLFRWNIAWGKKLFLCHSVMIYLCRNERTETMFSYWRPTMISVRLIHAHACSCFLLCKMAEVTQPETVTHELTKSFLCGRESFSWARNSLSCARNSFSFSRETFLMRTQKFFFFFCKCPFRGRGVKLSSWRATALHSLDATLIKHLIQLIKSLRLIWKLHDMWVGAGLELTLQGCGPPGTEFDTPALGGSALYAPDSISDKTIFYALMIDLLMINNSAFTHKMLIDGLESCGLL